MGRRLRHEATAHPKKAALLGLLGLVAVWFWGPLVWGWVRPTAEAKPAAPAAEVAAIPQAGGAKLVTDSQQPKDPGLPWDELVGWIQADPRTSPQAQVPGRPNPFHPAESQIAKAEKEKEAQKVAEAEAPPPDPASLGAVLSSTIVGPGGRAAVINGKTYRLGEDVTFSTAEQSAVFRLVEVGPEGVVLEQEGKRFDVDLSKPASSGRIEVVAATTEAAPQ